VPTVERGLRDVVFWSMDMAGDSPSMVHLPQELARVGGQAFDIAPLPFGIDGVEGEARFA